MKVVVELRDAASGVLIGRIIDYEQAREFQEPQLVNRVINLEEFRVGFARAARYTREAINVAKTERQPP
jgi:predicted Ser/Thr protein kinase